MKALFSHKCIKRKLFQNLNTVQFISVLKQNHIKDFEKYGKKKTKKLVPKNTLIISSLQLIFTLH